MSSSETQSDRELLIKLQTSLDLNFRHIMGKLDDLCKRLAAVEATASVVQDYPEFRREVLHKMEKYDVACAKSETCPDRWQSIEGRVSTLEGYRAGEDGEERGGARWWQFAQGLILLAVGAGLSYLLR